MNRSRENCVVLVAGSGGHLMQMYTLADRIANGARIIWVTDRTPQSESLLAEEDVVFLPYRAPRDYWGVVANGFQLFRTLRTRNFRGIYSTGAGIALSCLIPSFFMGQKFTYIESATRVTGLSLTGKVLNWVPRIGKYVQYPHAVNSQWKYALSVFDGFTASENILHAAPKRRLNIFVTVGANKELGFRRLIESLAILIGDEHDVYYQYGPTIVDDLHLNGAVSISSAVMQKRMEEADVIICHAGTGSTLMALNSGKLPIIVPRIFTLGEHVDDHQLELAKFLQGRNLAIVRGTCALTSEDIYRAAEYCVAQVDSLPRVSI